MTRVARPAFLAFGLVCALVEPLAAVGAAGTAPAAASFTLEQVKSYPFPTELIAAASGRRIAWSFEEPACATSTWPRRRSGRRGS